MTVVQLAFGGPLKFKYYLTNFINKDYVPRSTESIPCNKIAVNVFYFSLNFGLLKTQTSIMRVNK
jgi:hypothetical protein